MSLRTAKMRRNTSSHPKTRLISLPEWVIQPLERQMNSTEGEFVFTQMINSFRVFNRILKQAGIPKLDPLGQKVTAHSFRHTYATFMAESIGHNAFVLKSILGHERISTTERYCHPTAPTIELELPFLQEPTSTK